MHGALHAHAHKNIVQQKATPSNYDDCKSAVSFPLEMHVKHERENTDNLQDLPLKLQLSLQDLTQ